MDRDSTPKPPCPHVKMETNLTFKLHHIIRLSIAVIMSQTFVRYSAAFQVPLNAFRAKNLRGSSVDPAWRSGSARRSSATTPGCYTAQYSSLRPHLEELLRGEDLSATSAESALVAMMEGSSPEQTAALLSLLRMKGETAVEIAGMVRGMKSVAVPVPIAGRMLDIVGTGGDGANTINISTASSIVAAAAGAKVCKFGNRSASSMCGSADVLEALGVAVDMTPEEVSRCCEKCNIAFMFAPNHYPAMKKVASTRKALGIRTVFNILGPMSNPAGAQRVVIGVYDEALMPLMAGALREVSGGISLVHCPIHLELVADFRMLGEAAVR